MSKAKSPAFQFYPRDWLGDPEIMLMDWDAKAMHLHLICIAWMRDDACAIPDDDNILMKWVSVTDRDDWLKRLKPQIFSAWKLIGGMWTQSRLMREKTKQLANSVKRKAAADKRWNKEKEPSKSNTDGDASAMQKQYPSTSTSTAVIKNKGKNFKPPTINEVLAYCQERRNLVDPEDFINFYESKGWMIGKNKMKAWKAAVRTWEKNDNEKSGGNSASRARNVADRLDEIARKDIEENGHTESLG